MSATQFTSINGKPLDLTALGAKAILVVNTASKCGFTPQYKGLQALYEDKKDEGLVIVGVPSNDFGSQEPGTEEEVKTFCEINYGVTFPLFAKADVTGAAKQPLYAALTAAMPDKEGPAAEFRERLKGYGMTPTEDPEVLWNFEKFLIGKDGQVAARFAPGTEPSDPALLKAIDKALAK